MALATLLLAANTTPAREDTSPKRRLRGQATAHGFVGGESHDSYVVRARKGQMLSLQISWKHTGDSRAEFTVSDSPNLFDGGQVAFGKASDDGNRWSGRIPRTGDYYVYVVAYPNAHYTLQACEK